MRRRAWWLLLLPAAAVGFALSRTRPEEPLPEGPPFAVARRLVDRHCLGCHSAHPTIPAFPIAPGGIELDTAEQMHRYAARILTTVTLTRTMPLLNKTEMTEEERVLLGAWVRAGAKVQ